MERKKKRKNQWLQIRFGDAESFAYFAIDFILRIGEWPSFH